MDCQLQFSVFIISCCSAKEGWDNEALLLLSKIKFKYSTKQHPLQRIQNIIDGLRGNQYFTLLDLTKASHQPHLHPNSQKLTAFITPWGFYEWLRVPFDLMNFPAAFQRFMEHCLGAFRNNFAVP